MGRKSDSLKRQRAFVALGLAACVVWPANAQQSLLSASEIRTSPDSACYSALQPGVEIIAENLCEECAEHIKQHASSEDAVNLLEELAARKCGLESPLPEKRVGGWAIYVDQDLLALDSLTHLNDDRNYTMGVGLSFNGARFAEGWFAPPRETIDGLLSIHEQKSALERGHAFEVGVTAFTPNELEFSGPIPGDRPYASLLYFGNSKFTAYGEGYAVKSKFVLGVLGLDIAKAVQRYLHNDLSISNQDPLGWENQISEGGELTMLYSVERIGRPWRAKDHRTWDASYSVGARAGYYTDVSAGLDARWGRVVSPYYAHSGNPMSDYNHGVCHGCSGRDRYVFLSYRARAVAYNALLQGQFRDSAVTTDAGDVVRLLHEATAGVALRLSRTSQLTYALNYKSKEYQGPEEREHWFGGLYYSYNVPAGQ